MTASAERLAEVEALARSAPEPAAVGGVAFGTAGWTDPSLVRGQLFYPRGTSTARGRLEHYARHFSLVEVDATYYALPDPAQVAKWIDRTPRGFRFDVKAHASLTGHPIDVARLPSDLRVLVRAPGEATGRVPSRDLPDEVARELERRFREAVAPLERAGRLGA
ncbi:MAG: DUF72 domain-containing protein, partial [Deltaproteobacteria bacterium]|nr:DUF72 domain-containing protein [Deltaproteobacteria bacterium]